MTLNLKIKEEDNDTQGVVVSLKSIGGELSQGESIQVDFNQKIDVFYNDYEDYKLKANKVVSSKKESKIEP